MSGLLACSPLTVWPCLQATGEGGWSDNKPQDHEDLGTKAYKLHCNQDTMGMNPLLIANIKVSVVERTPPSPAADWICWIYCGLQASLYFRNLKDTTTFEATVGSTALV